MTSGFFRVSVAVIALALPCGAWAESVRSVSISGNERVEPETIKSYIGVREGDEYDPVKVDQSLKTLFATELFADAKMAFSKGVLYIAVRENPIVSQVAFEGNKRVEDEQLAKETRLKARSVYTLDAIRADTQRIINIYRKSGRYAVKVTPQVIRKEQNRVDIVYKIEEGEKTGINKVVFIGNEKFSDKALLGVIRTKESRWYRFFSSDDNYDPDRVEYDKELLRKFYTSRGYADFRVRAATAELVPDGNGFIVTYAVDEGVKYNIGKVRVDARIQDVSGGELEKSLDTRPGDEYNSEYVESSVDKLVKATGELGYAFVDVDTKIDRDKEARIINLSYVVSEGPKVFVDRININGNVRTLDKVIRREFRVAEGDPYNASLLKRSKQRIENLGFFEKVDFATERGSSPDRINVNVDVKEKSTGELTFGAGYATNDGILGDISLRERNLLGTGRNVKLSFSGSARRQQGELGVTEPYFMGSDVEAGFNLFKIRRDLKRESSYSSETNGMTLTAGYSITEHLDHNITYTLRDDDITDVDVNASRYIKDQMGERVTSMIGQSFVYDMRDSKFDPREGYMLRFNQDFAGIGGDVKFIRHELKGGYYLPLTKERDFVLKILGNGGYVNGLDEDVPINQRFFIGGYSLRGFQEAGIGPRDIVTKDSLGGNLYYTGTAELGFPLGLPEELGLSGALFADAGNLTGVEGSSQGVEDANSLRASVGAGLGWSSPLGPIRVDFAYPLVKDDSDKTKAFQFSFGTRF